MTKIVRSRFIRVPADPVAFGEVLAANLEHLQMEEHGTVQSVVVREVSGSSGMFSYTGTILYTVDTIEDATLPEEPTVIEVPKAATGKTKRMVKK